VHAPLPAARFAPGTAALLALSLTARSTALFAAASTSASPLCLPTFTAFAGIPLSTATSAAVPSLILLRTGASPSALAPPSVVLGAGAPLSARAFLAVSTDLSALAVLEARAAMTAVASFQTAAALSADAALVAITTPAPLRLPLTALACIVPSPTNTTFVGFPFPATSFSVSLVLFLLFRFGPSFAIRLRTIDDAAFWTPGFSLFDVHGSHGGL